MEKTSMCLCNGRIIWTSFDSFLTSYDCRQGYVLLRFLSSPDTEEVHTITITYITENGNKFETKQGQLLITK